MKLISTKNDNNFIAKYIIYRRNSGGEYLRKRKARFPYTELPRNVNKYRWEKRINPVYLAVFDDTPRDRKNASRLAKKYGGKVVKIVGEVWMNALSASM